MDTLVKAMVTTENVAIIALLLGNFAQAWFIVSMRRDHAKERETDRLDRHELAKQTITALDKLSEVITELRVVIATCGLRRDGGI